MDNKHNNDEVTEIKEDTKQWYMNWKILSALALIIIFLTVGKTMFLIGLVVAALIYNTIKVDDRK